MEDLELIVAMERQRADKAEAESRRIALIAVFGIIAMFLTAQLLLWF